MVRALAFRLENDAEEAPEIAVRPAFLLEPAKILGGKFVEFAAREFSERHFPRAQLFPVGGGLGGVHGRNMRREMQI